MERQRSFFFFLSLSFPLPFNPITEIKGVVMFIGDLMQLGLHTWMVSQESYCNKILACT
jgi:hypothetical protein